jgi:hypothetical protein
MVDAIAGRRGTPAFTVSAVIGSGGTKPEDHPRLGAVAALLRSRRPNQVRDGIHALDLAADPLRLAAGLVAPADCVLAGELDAGRSRSTCRTPSRWSTGR